MVQRKQRVSVVLDTNVFVRALKAGSNTNWNRRIVRLWLIERQLQLVVSPELIAEYLGIFADILGMETETVGEWRRRFETDGRASLVNLGRRYAASRDPDELLADYQVLMTDLQQTRDRLKDEFFAALNGSREGAQ